MIKIKSKHNIAVSQAILAAALYAISSPVSKLLLVEIPPMMMAAFLYLGAGIGMSIISFGQKRGIEDIALRDISPQFVSDFEHFLLVDCGLHRNSAMEVIKKFKCVMVIAHNNGMLSVNPFASYKFKFEATERGYLSEEELITLMQHPLNNPQTEMIRDVFVFCCFTGLSYIDVKRLREEHIQRSFDGSLWIMIKRQKTGTSSNIPLLPIPEQIIEKYRGMDMSGALLPVPDNTVGNRHLKALGKQCGINKKVTYHLARHNKFHYCLKTNKLQTQNFGQVTI